MLKKNCCIYFPWSTTTLIDFYSWDEKLKELHMSAAILPLQNGSEQRTYPDGFNTDVPCMLNTAMVGEEHIQWVRIRIESETETANHGCIGFTETELKQLTEPDTKYNRAERKNTKRKQSDSIENPRQQTKKKQKKTETTTNVIRITNEVRSFVLKLKIDLVKHRKVTIINDDNNKLIITYTEKNTQDGDQDDDVGS